MPLRLLRTETPQSAAEVAALVKESNSARTSLFPLGGETALDSGLLPRVAGMGMSLTKLDALIDYPARDMTITVGAGTTIKNLQATLAAEFQELPLDMPQAGQATIGGCIAANISGYRRLGQGTLRDYVIGIEAVDGQGTIFHGGGRVVKNVAGYDFCRLLIGSQGTLGVITQVTLKVKPLTPKTAVLLKSVANFDEAERAIESVLGGPQLPAGLELFSTLPDALKQLSDASAYSKSWLAIILQGTDSDVISQLSTMCCDLAKAGAMPLVMQSDAATILLEQLREFPQLTLFATPEALAIKLHFQPSRLFAGLQWLTGLQSGIRWQAHAGTGIVYALLPKLPAASLSSWLLQIAHPQVAKLGGRLQLWRVSDETDLTTTALWGPTSDALELNRAVRAQFDPQGILNRGRFWV